MSDWLVDKQGHKAILMNPSGEVIATVATESPAAEENLKTLARLLSHLSTGGQSPAELAALLDRLSCGPFALPLDQLTRLTNELEAWKALLTNLAGLLEKLSKATA